MPSDDPAALRALARWHTSRRAVDELVEPMLEYGPIAVDRVIDRLPYVQQAVRAEEEAFASFVSLVSGSSRRDAVVVDLYGRPSTVDVD
ncbi:MAG: hypothetical protein ABIO67_07790 [Mycobacteriales bacterium]